MIMLQRSIHTLNLLLFIELKAIKLLSDFKLNNRLELCSHHPAVYVVKRN